MLSGGTGGRWRRAPISASVPQVNASERLPGRLRRMGHAIPGEVHRRGRATIAAATRSTRRLKKRPIRLNTMATSASAIHTTHEFMAPQSVRPAQGIAPTRPGHKAHKLLGCQRNACHRLPPRRPAMPNTSVPTVNSTQRGM